MSVIKYVLQMSSLTLWLVFPFTGMFLSLPMVLFDEKIFNFTEVHFICFFFFMVNSFKTLIILWAKIMKIVCLFSKINTFSFYI